MKVALTFGAALGWAAAFCSTARAANDAPPSWGEPVTSSLPGDASLPHRPPGDGVYGRFGGRFDLGLDAGAELSSGGAAASLRATAHYFFMAGAYVGYTDAFGNDSFGRARALSFGVDLQPAFIPRWSNDLEQAGDVGDLAIDSISLALGAYFAEPVNGSFGDGRGFEASLGFGVPLAGTARGPWLGARGILSWDDPKGGAATKAWGAALLTFGWRIVVGG
jgi:hypothetical protein